MELLKTILAVGSGSFLGGAGRYLVSLAMKDISKGFPWATLAVNLIGCFLIGLLWGVFGKNGTDGSNWALFLTVGFCGGFTTFSTFSKEAIIMLQTGHVWGFAAYVSMSVVVGVALVALGYFLVR
ncbi:MAG: fluoride efflux transporter CrcB [Bacteroidales bacterium]|nr:fluoride efflux transporter CrcB [Bacteroidales bacterium]